MKTSHLVMVLAATGVLAACGSGNNGGGDGPAPVALVPGTDVPVSATTDSSAAIDFVMQVVARGEANTDTPLVLGDVTLAIAETADPVTIIAA